MDKSTLHNCGEKSYQHIFIFHRERDGDRIGHTETMTCLLYTSDKFRIATSSASCFEVICLGLAIKPTTETVVVEKHVEVSSQQKESEYVVPTVKLKEPEKPVEMCIRDRHKVNDEETASSAFG